MKNVFAGVPGRPLEGRFWRMLAPRWSHAPLSGDGAARAGGRWNEQGQPALYLSAEHGTAITEYHQDLPRPGTLTAYDVFASAVLDLRDAAILAAAGLRDDHLRENWKRVRDVDRARPQSWDIAVAARDAGHQGLLVPSARAAGTNLVLWIWNEPGGARVAHVDPFGDLPQDQRSWRKTPP